MKGRAVTDVFGRPLRTLRLSITDRCNLRCRYCMPAEVYGPDFTFLPRSEVLTYEEMASLVRAFTTVGVRRVRITGGEPLLRRDLSSLVRLLAAIDPPLDLSLTTNGIRLGAMAAELREAGLRRINVSLDGLDPRVASDVAGRPVDPERIWEHILQARDFGLKVKVNAVLRPGLNESEALPLAQRCREAGLELRFIEYMDVGKTNGWQPEDVVTGAKILAALSRQWKLVPAPDPDPHETARRYVYTDKALEVGFINSISEPFCGGCDRARISASGTLYTCLFADTGVSLKAWLREEGLGEAAIAERLARHWGQRTDRYSELREAGGAVKPAQRPEMWSLGG